jgi:LemA protein
MNASHLALFLGAILLLALVFIYNRLVRSRMRTLEAWSGIDVQLKRRADLIPNFVNTVKGYAAHERGLFEAVTSARSALQQASRPAAAANANARLSETLTHLLALVEDYPQLQASQSFLSLQNELSDIEEKIGYARQFYNRNVLDYNTRIHTFPRMLVAWLFGFYPVEFFEADQPARAAVSVQLEDHRRP